MPRKMRKDRPNMLVIQKFGGTSVGSVERIMNVARHMLKTQAEGHQVIGVVSAMAGETNRLAELATRINPQPWSKEYDMLLASGEQVSVALLSLAINSLGGRARGVLGHQLGIRTDSVYSKARIQGIKTDLLWTELNNSVIPIVAGFQGVDVENNITTLGRGGSDTSAVAIAAALQAEVPGTSTSSGSGTAPPPQQPRGALAVASGVLAEIYTDVDGVYTTDPRICPKARKLRTVSYEEMMELASLGAKVLQIRSVELAAKYRVPVEVRSSFDFSVEGTRVVAEDSIMEHVVVSGIAADINDAMISVSNIEDRPGIAAEIFAPLAEASIVVDVIVQASASGAAGISFTVPKPDLPRALKIIEEVLRPRFSKMSLSSESNLGKVSIVGVGMRNHPGVAAKMFKVLAQSGVNIRLISTSEIKVTVLVDADRVNLAVQKLHSAFDLDATE